MKCKITSSDVERLGNIIVVPYGTDLHDRVATACNRYGYNAGQFGWNYDVYCIGKYTLVIGYRPLNRWIKQGGLSFARAQQIANTADAIYIKHTIEHKDITRQESISLALTDIFG